MQEAEKPTLPPSQALPLLQGAFAGRTDFQQLIRNAIAQAAIADVQAAIGFAKASPAPDVSEVTRYVYAEAAE